MVRKEVRALWLAWTGTAAACVIVAVANQPRFTFPGRFAYFLGSVALAAMSIGHEYTHGTLPMLLSLPVDRRRLMIAKLLAVVPLLATLALLTLTIGPGGPYFERGRGVGMLSVVTAVSLAPWLTMLCRNPLAGGVFALGVAGGLQLVAFGLVWLWAELGGSIATELQTLHDRVLVALLIATSLVGAVAGWRTFLRLEAADGRDPALTWPRWLRSRMALDEDAVERPARRSRPLWLLVKKELRLQQISIAVAAINAAMWLVEWSVVSRNTATDGILAAVGVMYGALLAVLIGAVASATERQMGTHAWQQLLPVSAWRQWLVKTAVALGLSLGLSFVLTVLLARGNLSFSPLFAGAVVILTIGGLLISSLCRNALQAMTVSAPALLVVATLLGWSLSFDWVGPKTAMAAAAGLAALAWWLAFVNHRTARS